MTDFGFDTTGIRNQLEKLRDRKRAWSGEDSWYVGTAVEYAVYIEFGTSKMDPKPFFRPALTEARRDLETFVADNTETTMQQVDGIDELVETIAFALERRVKEIITEKGLVDTGAMRASVQAVRAKSKLKAQADVASRSDVDLEPGDFQEASA